MMKRLLAICAILLASCVPLLAQQPVTVIGAVQAGHCVSFFSTTQIQDTGAGCGLGGGGVSSVALQMPVNTFAVAGSPVTTSGTLNATLITQAPNTFFAGPSAGGPLAPTWRALTSTDLPIIGAAQGGTGLASPTAHSLLIAEGAAPFNLIPAASAGRMVLDQGPTLDFAAVAMSGDCTLIGTGAIVCTKTNGTAFGTFATQNFATPPAIGGTTPNAGTFSTLSATSITDTGITGSVQCLQVNAAGLISGIGAACGAVGPVSSVSNTDTTLTISPTTGVVVASLNLAKANTWSALQTFSAGISASAITNTGITGSTQCLQVNSAGLMSGTGTACGAGGGAVSSVTNADGTLTISPTTGAVVASLALAHANTWTAKQTISGASFSLTGNQSSPAWTTNGIRYVNVPGVLTDTSSTGTVAAAYTGFFGGNTIAASNATTFTNYYEYYYTAPIAGSNVTFTNSWALGADNMRIAGNATIAGTLTLGTDLSLANGGTNATLTASNGGIIYSTASAFAVLAGTVTAGQCLLSGSSAAPSWGSCTGAAAVSSVTAADSTLTITPTTGAVTAKINLGNANTWTAKQTISGAGFALSGNISSAAWTTNGIKYANVVGTVTDTTSSGTVAAAYTDVFGGDTVASSIVTTFTNYYAQYIKAPVNGANVTFTNGWALGADSFKVNGALNATGSLTFTGLSTGTQVSCLGLSAANAVVLSAAACATPGGSTTQLQYNNAGAFGGIAGATSNGTVVTFANNDLLLRGSSTGVTTFSSANAGASNFTITIPAVTDTVAVLGTPDQTLSGGANVTSGNLGTKTTGTTTIDCGAVPLQRLVDGGAFTLAAPANDGSCIVQSTNNASAGVITFSGFSVGSNTGDALTTTNAQVFSIFIWRINGVSGYRVAAHQ